MLASRWSHKQRLVCDWITGIRLDPSFFETHSLRRTKATPIYRRTGNLRAMQRCWGTRRSKVPCAISGLRSTTLLPYPNRLTSDLSGQSAIALSPSRGIRAVTEPEAAAALFDLRRLGMMVNVCSPSPHSRCPVGLPQEGEGEYRHASRRMAYSTPRRSAEVVRPPAGERNWQYPLWGVLLLRASKAR
jgi:hypothetical protein